MIKEEFEKKFVSLRRAAISLDFAHLNSTQLESVMATQGPLLLLAAPGAERPPYSSTALPTSLNTGAALTAGTCRTASRKATCRFLGSTSKRRPGHPAP